MVLGKRVHWVYDRDCWIPIAADEIDGYEADDVHYIAWYKTISEWKFTDVEPPVQSIVYDLAWIEPDLDGDADEGGRGYKMKNDLSL